MAKAYEAPAGVDIAAMKNKNKSSALDLMRPGPGTPWEDRGSLGLLKAFLATCGRSITSPGLLLDHIRRPDTAGEASRFAYGCSAFWGVSTFVHLVLLNVFYPVSWRNQIIGYESSYYIKAAVLSVLVAGGVYFLGVVFASRMYFAMVSTELKNAAPRVLLHNMFCYCLGPSILALVPVVGPPLALLLIFGDWCVAGAKRLYITWRGGIVAAVLTMGTVLVMMAVGWFVAGMVLNNVLGLIEPPPIEKLGPGYGGS